MFLPDALRRQAVIDDEEADLSRQEAKCSVGRPSLALRANQ